MMEFDRIRVLMEGKSREEKVAGLLLAQKLVERASSDVQVKEIIKEVVSFLGPSFLTGLLSCKSNSTKPSDSRMVIQRAALDMLVQAVQSSLLSSSAVLLLVDAWFKLISLESSVGDVQPQELPPSTIQTLMDMLLLIKWMTKEITNDTKNDIFVLDHVLQKILSAATRIPVSIMPLFLEFVADVASMESSSQMTIPTTIIPSDTAPEALRILLAMGFHGGAPEVVRDASLSSCQQILSTRIPANWTVETASTIPQVPTTPQDSTFASSPQGRFAMLLMSVVGVEVHLLLEEAIALMEQLSKKTTEKSTPEENSMRPEVINERVTRLLKMLPCCLALLDQCLALLVGRNDNEVDDDDYTPGIWSLFPSAAMLHIKQSAHSILQKLFDFLRDISSIYSSYVCTEDTEKNAVEGSSGLQKIHVMMLVQQSVAALSVWTCEDEALQKPYLDQLSSLLGWSRIKCDDMDKDESIVFAELCQDGSNSSGTSSSFSNGDGNSSASASAIVGVNAGAGAGDVLHYVIPCLTAIADSITPTDNPTECQQLCTADRTLFGRLLLLVIVASNHASQLVSSLNNTDTKFEMKIGMTRLCRTVIAACELLGTMLEWKQNDIQVLRRCDGDDMVALRSVFGFSSEGGADIQTLPAIPHAKCGTPYLQALGDLLATASGILVAIDDKASSNHDNAALVDLDVAICTLLKILDHFT